MPASPSDGGNTPVEMSSSQVCQVDKQESSSQGMRSQEQSWRPNEFPRFIQIEN